MTGKRTKNTGLPQHMTVRTYTNKHGDKWVGYYYMTPRDTDGRRRAIPLGSDLALAKRRWAELEGTPVRSENSVGSVFMKYMAWAEDRSASGLSLLSIRDYKAHWKFLEPVFGRANIDRLQPAHMLRYFDGCSSKIRGKKEIKFLSVLFNWSRARGYMTAPNPCTGITRQMRGESRRTIYVTNEDFARVYRHAIQPLRDAMDLAILTGQRPADVFKMRWTDISDGVLNVIQNKTGATVRIAVTGRLADVLDRIKAKNAMSSLIVTNAKGQPFANITFRRAFDDARNKAAAEAAAAGEKFTRFQFKDLRAKAATDSSSQTTAQKLLGHKNAATTVIYRRDKSEVVEPLMDKSLLSIIEEIDGN